MARKEATVKDRPLTSVVKSSRRNGSLRFPLLLWLLNPGSACSAVRSGVITNSGARHTYSVANALVSASRRAELKL
jgi:hypothetical protein